MIRAICLNPAIDRNYYIDHYRPGVPYRHTTCAVEAGGKGLNAAKACVQLGARTACYGFLGQENSARHLNVMKEYRVENRMITVPGETRTTVNVIDRAEQTESEILEEGPLIGPEQTEALLRALRQETERSDIVLCSGLSSLGLPADIYVQINRICADVGAHCVLDTNGANLSDSLSGHYLMIKPNARELCELAGHGYTDESAALIGMAKQLLSVSDYVLISRGKAGGLLVGKNRVWEVRVPGVSAVSTIGCGDSTVAGFAVAFARGYSEEMMARFALACGTANALTSAPGQLALEELPLIMAESVCELINEREMTA